jgi:hypothetical protein
MSFFWVSAPCRLVGRSNVSEKHTVSIFRAEDGDSMLHCRENQKSHKDYVHFPTLFNHN